MKISKLHKNINCRYCRNRRLIMLKSTVTTLIYNVFENFILLYFSDLNSKNNEIYKSTSVFVIALFFFQVH